MILFKHYPANSNLGVKRYCIDVGSISGQTTITKTFQISDVYDTTKYAYYAQASRNDIVNCFNFKVENGTASLLLYNRGSAISNVKLYICAVPLLDESFI